MSLKKVIEAINQNKSFLITSHIGLEGDAIGSEFALAYLLKQKNKDVIVINEDAIPKNYNFLNNRRLIRPLDYQSVFMRQSKKDKQDKIKSPDAVFILDCSDFARCGKVSKFISKGALLVSIDHHISNSWFADINWIEPKSSSTGEMIYKLYKAMHISFDRKSALYLYTALVTDTGSFRYSATSSYTHQVAAELIKFDILPNQVYQNIYESNSYSDIVALKNVLNTLTVDRSGKIAWFKINKYVANSGVEQTDNILDFARRMKDVEATFLLKKFKNKDSVRVNLRSKGKIDVNKIAQYFGGGGHKNASGCTIKGTLARVEKMVLGKIRETVKKL